MSFNNNSVAVIILNWNGWEDTIECLESVLHSDYPFYRIILIDNCSSDDSVERIIDWASGKADFHIESHFAEMMSPELPKPISFHCYHSHDKNFWDDLESKLEREAMAYRSIVLIQNEENIGFAAGNNLGIKIDQFFFASDYIYLLNNDVVIEPTAMRNLVEALEANPEIGAATSAIYYYSQPEKIANMGGEIFWWGNQRYHKKPTSEKIKLITFTSGCSLMIRRNIIQKYGALSENFFFGEEDFELSWRLRKNKIPLICVTRSKVYHKESISSSKLFESLTKKKFIHVFNRFIDMKNNYSPLTFALWKWVISVFYFFWLIMKHRESVKTSFKFVRALYIYTRQFSDARKTTIDKIYTALQL